MFLKEDNLLIRNANPDDAPTLCSWWNDGGVMAHAGFPNGLGTTPEAIVQRLANDSDTTYRRLIIEVDSVPVGEMSYRNVGNGIAEIGIKICNPATQNRGLGTKFLNMLIGSLLYDMGYEKIILDTNVKNTRAQRVYEKVGFKRVGVRIDAWKDQLGELQSSIDYVLTKDDFLAGEGACFSGRDLIVRQAENRDLGEIKIVVKEAFYRPGKNSQFNEWEFVDLVRKDAGFVPELCLVATLKGEMVGYILLSKAQIGASKGLSLGPLAVRPTYQRKGIGKQLIQMGLKRAEEQGFEWVALTGGDYYFQFEFEPAAKYKIVLTENHPENPYLKVKFLKANRDVSGELRFCESFYDENGELI